MACPHGTRKKAGAPEYDWIDIAQIWGCADDDSSPECQFLRLVGNQVVLVETNELCSSVFNIPPPLQPSDFLIPTVAVQKFLAHGRAMNWLANCECTPAPPPPPPPPPANDDKGNCYSGYYVQRHLVRTADNTDRGSFTFTLPGRFLGFGSEAAPISKSVYQADRIWVWYQRSPNSPPEKGVDVPGNPGDQWRATVLSIQRWDGAADNCPSGTIVVPPPEEPPPPPPPEPDRPFIPPIIIPLPPVIFPPGIPGLPGLPGPSGATGARGPQGEKGAKGDDGELKEDERECLFYSCRTTKRIYQSLTETDGMADGKTEAFYLSPPGQSGKFTVDGRIKDVLFTLTKVPANLRTQSGQNADDIAFAGWFYWFNSGGNSPRVPLHFSQQRLLPPPGTDGYSGFAYTLPEGCQGTAKLTYFDPTQTPPTPSIP